MGYLTEFEEDVFISYATIDNDRFPGEEAPWVAQLHADLLARVRSRLGDDSVRLWRDPEIRNNEEFERLIKGRLSKTAALLSILSPSFLKRKWTLLELETFVEQAHRGGGLLVNAEKSRIFKVEKIEVPREELPAPMQGTKSYKFFKQDPEQPSIKREFRPQLDGDRLNYFKELDNLAIDIANLLRDMARSVPKPDRMAVYVAETTSDLDDQRKSVRRELSDRGYAVLPEGDLTHRAVTYVDEVRQNLARAVLSVHLVGARYGLIPEGETRSIVRIQHDLAMERSTERSTERGADPGFTRMIWMAPDLAPLEDDQRRFIEYLRNDADVQRGAEIMETGLDGLKTALHDKLAAIALSRDRRRAQPLNAGDAPAAAAASAAGAASAGPGPQPGEPLVIYVICDKLDLPSGHLDALKNFLFDQGHEPVLPTAASLRDGSLTRHLENLKTCDACLIFYGEGSPEWLADKLSDYRQYLRGRARPVMAKAVYIVPPDTGHKRELRTNEALVMRADAEFSGAGIDAFVKLLRPARQAAP